MCSLFHSSLFPAIPLELYLQQSGGKRGLFIKVEIDKLLFSETKLSATIFFSKCKGKEQVLRCLQGKISPMNLVHWRVM